MTTRQVYLAGAIFNVIGDAAVAWRVAAKSFMPIGWTAIDPLDFETANLVPRELVALDYAHIEKCQAVIARVQSPSWGTPMELAYAKRIGIPVLAWGASKKMSESPWLVAHVTRYFSSLKDACRELDNVCQ